VQLVSLRTVADGVRRSSWTANGVDRVQTIGTLLEGDETDGARSVPNAQVSTIVSVTASWLCLTAPAAGQGTRLATIAPAMIGFANATPPFPRPANRGQGW
jgi:hypothetical protein